MLGLVGIKKSVPVNIREKFSINNDNKEKIEKKLKENFREFLILNTCNRTEIYFNHSLKEDEALKKIFKLLSWDINLKDCIFYFSEEDAVTHLFKVSCGYHSKIFGEDQILGQIRDSYFYSKDKGFIKKKFTRLFEDAIACGKKFRKESKLYEIPVSSSSIVARKISDLRLNNIVILGFGEVGKLIFKYLYSKHIENITIVVRDKSKVIIEDSNVKIITFDELKENIKKSDCIIGATSSPKAILYKDDFKDIKSKMKIFDLAIPRDIDEKVSKLPNIEILHIDEISKIDDENKELRKDRMRKYKYIVKEAIDEYIAWEKLRDLSNVIKELNIAGDEIYKKRYTSYKNKANESNKHAKKMMKSISDAYVHSAIEVLKSETLEGRGKECLRIIEKIFLEKN